MKWSSRKMLPMKPHASEIALQLSSLLNALASCYFCSEKVTTQKGETSNVCL